MIIAESAVGISGRFVNCVVDRVSGLGVQAKSLRRWQPKSGGTALHRPVDIFVNNVSSFSADIFT
jgi:hypothetical protein